MSTMTRETRNRVPCTGCALLCDDLAVEVERGTIVKVHNACLRGSKKFHAAADKERLRTPLVRNVAGGQPRPVSLDEAFTTCRQLLGASRSLLIAGGAKLSNEAQQAVLDLATICSATVAIEGLDVTNAWEGAITRQGMVSCTLGEAINNADLLLFWGANPIDQAPKLVSKVVFSRGRHRQTGKEVKKFAVIDTWHTPTMERADIKVNAGDHGHGSVLASLVAALKTTGAITGADASLVTTALGANASQLVEEKALITAITDLASTVSQAEYPVILASQDLAGEGEAFIDALLALARVLAGKVNLAIIPVQTTTNATGLFQSKAMAGDTCKFVDVNQLAGTISSHDVIITFGCDLASKLPADTLTFMKDIPVISVDYKDCPTTRLARVVIPASITGVESGGIATRFDGAAIALSPPARGGDTTLDDAIIAARLRDGWKTRRPLPGS